MSSPVPIEIDDDHVSTHSIAQSRTPTVYEGQVGRIPSAEKKEAQLFVVEFEPDDPDNPHNWSRSYRWFLTFASGLLVLNATFASAAPSGILPSLMEQMDFSEEVASLVVAIFVAGYCVGPLLWGPLSEQIGRRPVFLISFVFYTGFQVGCALSRNTASMLVFRFLSGVFAAAPLTNSGALLGDIWDASTRGKAMTLFSCAPFAGPALGPTVSGWIEVTGTDWRWLFWVLTMFAGVCLVLTFFTIKETYSPVLLVQKARRVRKETGDSRYYAPLEDDKLSISDRLNKILATPFKILFQEPVLIALTVYMSFIYGCMYLLFEAYPIVFTQDHHLNAGFSGLMFLPISLGGLAGVGVYLLVFSPRYDRYIKEYAPLPVPPEKRMEVMAVAAPLYAISFFWFGWTSYSWISFWAPMMAGSIMGFSILLLMLSLINYIVDTYLYYAASALSANTVARSIFVLNMALQLFATQMFNALNPRWASTLLGCFAALMVPMPFLLIRYGPFLRTKSKFAPNLSFGTLKNVPEEKELTVPEDSV
ncbi:major facilitator superfamily domain-containing protein [Vararia minispora EC-137]|uniref:Major facilitator superfamily domain-containing protein n=1 Tax=Vararia minispora EC-137 TaxID=1314806 RepID=A0ACB8QGB8_9AGAM|nr:major facilitator superfamily domain-containing protein [Vararia minispora EC-137]